MFKDQLAMFLLKEWQQEHYGPILENKTLVVSHVGICVHITFNEQDAQMNVEHPTYLKGSHGEAHTLLAFHGSCSTEI